MEVHHAKISKDKAKHFREYLLEGLMIFLAVFMGFIAENIREHISDNSKAKKYLASLYTDIKNDSAQLNDIIVLGEKLAKGQDSLLTALKARPLPASSIDTVYQLFFKYGSIMPEFNATERTFNQLINTGNFRLIENEQLSDSIVNYYDKVKTAEAQAKVVETNTMDCVVFAQNIFKLEYGLHMNAPHKSLLTDDAVTMEKYRNKLVQMRISEQYYIMYELNDLKKSCLHLIHLLEKVQG
ncbi:MAG: hypothetical protein KGO81_10870 [Bacteroidota bacterium]|nr:hypothetical protein [Bacteroidota bacterium]